MIKKSFIESLKSAIKNIVVGEIDDIKTTRPAKVVSYDSDKGTVSVTLVVGKKMIGDQKIDLPRIDNIPVLFSGNNNFSINFKPEKDDEALLVFSDIDISGWVHRKLEGNPESLRRFNINDCFAIITKTSIAAPLLASDETLSIISGDSTIVAKTDGSVVINGHLEVTL